MAYIHAHSRTVKGTLRVLAARPKFYIGKISLMFMLMIFIGLLGVIYLVNFNAKATIGYEVSRLESQRDELLNRREQNNLDLSRSRSLDFIETSSVVGRMVHPSSVIYYDGNTAVALNR